MFDFYPRVPHVCTYVCHTLSCILGATSTQSITVFSDRCNALVMNTLPPFFLQTFTKYCTYYSRIPLYKHTWKTAIYDKALCLVPNAFYLCILCKYHLNWYHKYLVHALKRNKPHPCHPHAVAAETPALRWKSVSRQRLMKTQAWVKDKTGVSPGFSVGVSFTAILLCLI